MFHSRSTAVLTAVLVFHTCNCITVDYGDKIHYTQRTENHGPSYPSIYDHDRIEVPRIWAYTRISSLDVHVSSRGGPTGYNELVDYGLVSCNAAPDGQSLELHYVAIKVDHWILTLEKAYNNSGRFCERYIHRGIKDDGGAQVSDANETWYIGAVHEMNDFHYMFDGVVVRGDVIMRDIFSRYVALVIHKIWLFLRFGDAPDLRYNFMFPTQGEALLFSRMSV